MNSRVFLAFLCIFMLSAPDAFVFAQYRYFGREQKVG